MIKPETDSCHLLLDSRFANEEVQKNPYTYNNIREAVSYTHLIRVIISLVKKLKNNKGFP